MEANKVSPQRVACLYTTFPKGSETFLQREVRELRRRGCLSLEIHSIWGGQSEFEGMTVTRWPRWRMLVGLVRLPIELLQRPRAFSPLIRAFVNRRPTSWLNTFENLIGLAWALAEAPRFRPDPPGRLHAAWGSLPATAAWMLSRLTGIPWSFEAHAYDIFEYGGDWLLPGKCRHASAIRTSTEAGRRRLSEAGAEPDRIALIRRGINLRNTELEGAPGASREPEQGSPQASFRILSVGRMVEKKGWLRQPAILAELQRRGIQTSAVLVGDGPLRSKLARALTASGVSGYNLAGALPEERVRLELTRADCFLYTGETARSGDRDGFPNVLIEALLAGCCVVTSPAGAIAEILTDRQDARVIDSRDPADWADAIEELARDCGLRQALVEQGLQTVAKCFDVSRNAAALEVFLARIPLQDRME